MLANKRFKQMLCCLRVILLRSRCKRRLFFFYTVNEEIENERYANGIKTLIYRCPQHVYFYNNFIL